MMDGFRKLFIDRNQNTIEIWKYEDVFTFRIFSNNQYTEFCFNEKKAKEIIDVINEVKK